MRRLATLSLAVPLIVVAGIAAPRMYPTAQAADTPAKSITVSATGQVQIAPDVAFVSLGILQTDLNAGKAQSEMNAIAATALAKIKALGIPDRDIQTSSLSLDPQYDDHGALTGFQASESFTVTVEHLGQAGTVIDAGVSAGANRNVNVSFGLKDQSAATSAALKAAVVIAQRKATAVAGQLGFSLQGAKISVVENSQQSTPLPLGAERLATSGPGVAAPTQIQAGLLTVTDNVTVTYTV